MSASETDKVNILLVDDQSAKLLSYEVILQELGENLLMATSGRQALEHLLKHDVAVVLVDVCMPNLDGFELAAMIREHPRCEKTAIIFISAIHLTDVDRMRGYEMGAVDYVPVPVIPEVLRAKVKIFVELYRKTRQLEQLNRELEQRVADRTAELESYAARLLQSERRRSLALAAGQMGSWDWDVVNGDCMWDEGHCRIFGVDPRSFKVTPERIKALLDPEDWQRLEQAWYAAVENGGAFETEFRVRRPNGELRWCLGTAAASLDSSNRIVRISGVTIDITDRKMAEDRQAFLAREVDHRARNVLAVVQSMLRLTKADTAEEYIEAVEGRINALARAHMLLSECRWQGADLGRLIIEELEPYRSEEADRVLMQGPDVLLTPRSAQTLALAVHELATNAAKYGALTLPSGKIKLNWSLDEDRLALDWVEVDGPRISPPTTQGYGTRVIRASIEQLGGSAKFDWDSQGLACRLGIPLSDPSKRPERGGNGTRAPAAAGRPGFDRAGGNNVLLVEDESLVAMMMTEALSEFGCSVIGPYGTVSEALAAVVETGVHAAILDINLGDELVYPVADLLLSRGVPFAFVTGYGAESIEPQYAGVPVLQKPVDRNTLRQLFFAGKPSPARFAGVRDEAPRSAASLRG